MYNVEARTSVAQSTSTQHTTEHSVGLKVAIHIPTLSLPTTIWQLTIGLSVIHMPIVGKKNVPTVGGEHIHITTTFELSTEKSSSQRVVN